MAGDGNQESDYIERICTQVREKSRRTGMAEELFQNKEYSAARDILRTVLPLHEECEARLEVLLKIAECDVALYAKIESNTDKEISEVLNTMFPSYVDVQINAGQMSNTAAVIMYRYACQMAVLQARPNNAVSEIEKYIIRTHNIILEMNKSAETKKMAHKAVVVMHDMAAEMKKLDNASDDLRALAEGTCLNQIGYIYNDFGRPRTARPFLEEGRKVMEAVYKGNATRYHIFSCLANNIGYTYSKDGDHAMAALYYGKAVAGIQKSTDATESYKATTLTDYEQAYVRELSHPSVDPAEVERISNLTEREKGLKHFEENVQERVQNVDRVEPAEIEKIRDITELEKDLEQAEVNFQEKDQKQEIFHEKDESENVPIVTPSHVVKGQESGNFVNVGNQIEVDHTQCLQEDPCLFRGKLNGKEVAVNRMTFHKQLAQQVERLIQLQKHPNTVDYLSYSIVDSTEMPGIRFPYIAMEERGKDTLYELAADQSFSERERVDALRQVMLGLCHIHSNDIVHGDLIPNNVSRSLDGRHFKIGDFGLNTNNRRTRMRTSSHGVMAPDTELSKKYDIFSAGLIFYHVLSLGNSDGAIDLKRLVSPDAEIALDLVMSMVHEDENERPTAAEVLKHPFFWSNDKRLRFYSDVARCIEKTPDEGYQTVLDELNTKIGSMLNKNWMEDLTSGGSVSNKTSQKIIADVKTASTNTDSKTTGEAFRRQSAEDSTSPSGLIFFIGNKYAELDDAEKGEMVDEMWGFFSARFPQLFTNLYRIVKKQTNAEKDPKKYDVNWDEVTPYFDVKANWCMDPAWTKKRKLQFVIKISADDQLMDLYEHAGPDIFGNSWMDKLFLSKTEKQATQARLQEIGSKIKVEKWAVLNRAVEGVRSDEQKYDQKSLNSLLKFIANLATHFKDDSNQMKAIFGHNSDNVWEFFDSRFPDLFGLVRGGVSSSPMYDSIVSGLA